MITDLAGRFSGRRTFIEDLEKVIPEFYDKVGQHLRRWTPGPPSIDKEEPVQSTDAVDVKHPDNPPAMPADSTRNDEAAVGGNPPRPPWYRPREDVDINDI